MQKKVKKIVEGVAVVFLLVVGYVLFVHDNMKKVPVVDVLRLVSCITADTCRVPSESVSADGRRFSSLRLVAAQQGEIWYSLGENNSLKVLILVENNPVLLEDLGYTGVVGRVTQVSNGSEHTFEAGDPGFETNLYIAQHVYFQAMELAKRYVIPKAHSKQI